MMPSRSALIGYTGFVGSTLSGTSQRGYTDQYNSSNINDIRGQHFELMVCAGVSAVKWKANAEPADDWTQIKRLIDPLSTTTADRFVLISTVDVYPSPINVSENDEPSLDKGHPYGRHRLLLEHFIATKFGRAHIVRLPALFGPGLKKNALFDLLTGNMIDRISPNGVFQWYPVSRLATDIARIIDADLRLINIAPEPCAMSDIVRTLFPDACIAGSDVSGPYYDVKTSHAELLGGSGHYHLSAAAVMDEMEAYVSQVRATGGPP